ncbi:MAG: hypothetical protein Q8N17_09665 [Burkholderiaceae bacterium]|nr:hypothetical protein [Burkholderiaceae bacterium]MDP3136582.1 hypothetical protein [Burkholderiaceae bacterium]
MKRTPSFFILRVATPGLAFVLAACASGPRPPDWQINARDSGERFVQAYLSGQPRVDALEFDRARAETTRTGQPQTVARIELLRCAARTASLVLEPCAGFEVLRQDAAAPERAYADYLAGRLQPQDIALLTPAQRGVAAASEQAAPAALGAIADPLSRLVAAAVLLQTGRASPGVITQAVDTASAQGWRRPLLAWLGVQEQRALQAGDAAEAQRLRRRIDLVLKAP